MNDQRHRKRDRVAAKNELDDPQGAWFAPKRYGYGATPVRWQGWALVAAYIAAMLGIGSSGLPVTALVVLIAAVTVAFIVITIHKTPGAWRWRWGRRN